MIEWKLKVNEVKITHVCFNLKVDSVKSQFSLRRILRLLVDNVTGQMPVAINGLCWTGLQPIHAPPQRGHLVSALGQQECRRATANAGLAKHNVRAGRV